MSENRGKIYFCPISKDLLIRKEYGPYVSYNCPVCDRGFGDISKDGFYPGKYKGLKLSDMPKGKKNIVRVLKKLEDEKS